MEKLYRCEFCDDATFEKITQLRSHKSHCKLNPKCRTYENTKSWNKGLTKETSEKVRNSSIKLKEGYASGRLVHNWKNKNHSDTTKNKISESQKRYYDQNPDKVPYRLYHGSKQSYPEMIFEKYLKEYSIEGWIYNYQFGRYNFDFAFPEWKLDVEIDGQTHNKEKVKLIDKERDEYTISQGWKVIRFKAADIRDNVYDCINIVLREISYPKLIEIPKEFLNKKTEKLKKEIEKAEQKKNKQEKRSEDKRLKEEARKEQSKKVILKNRITKDYVYIKIINQILSNNKNKYGIIQIIAEELKLSHTSIRRICKRNNIEIFKRKTSI